MGLHVGSKIKEREKKIYKEEIELETRKNNSVCYGTKQ